ncbi:hypothetical protein CDL12_01465 [Handroanthus impetiginosus]|uniref:RING-CH-type domain-containing protein n=1 Tax=Handroanthus impetiginosus TaxID=429701 RepID=A0A2G9I7P5_9LAMI|nr:hypothetical protein CDL12_01465 [Handroanthus impetiginosus]
MESSDESQDMSKGQLSSIATGNSVYLSPPWGTVGSGRCTEFALPPNFPRTRKLELNEKEFVTITEKTSQLNFQEDNVLKTKRNCNFTFMHESCATEWLQKKGDNKCNVCGQDIQNIPVTLSTNHNSSNTNKKVKRNSTYRRYSTVKFATDN